MVQFTNSNASATSQMIQLKSNAYTTIVESFVRNKGRRGSTMTAGDAVDFAARIALRRISDDTIASQHIESRQRGLGYRIFRCLVQPRLSRSYMIAMFCRPNLQKSQQKLASDPRLNKVLDRVVISVIRKVEKTKPICEKKKCLKATEEEDEEDTLLIKKDDVDSKLEKEHDNPLKDKKEEQNLDQKDEEKETVVNETEQNDDNNDCATNEDTEASTIPATAYKKKKSIISKKFHSKKKHLTQLPKSKKLLEPECPICWEPYQVSQKICWSVNEKCPHAFHAECMVMWLMKNDYCPLCRCNYIKDK